MPVVYKNIRSHSNQEIRSFGWGLEGFEKIYYNCVSSRSFACFERSFKTSESLIFPIFPCRKLFLVIISYIVIGTHWLAKFNLWLQSPQSPKCCYGRGHTNYGACFSKTSTTLSPESFSTLISLGLR